MKNILNENNGLASHDILLPGRAQKIITVAMNFIHG